MALEAHPFEPARTADFFRLHSDANGAGWCRCVAWWVPSWEGWGERSAEENRALRERLLARGQFDGYLLYLDDGPIGWCQVGPRDRLEKLVRWFQLEPDPEAWAITCFLIAPAFRRRRLAAFLLERVVADLRLKGIRFLEAFPKRGEGLDETEIWTGPEALFRSAGFIVLREDPSRPVLRLTL